MIASQLSGRAASFEAAVSEQVLILRARWGANAVAPLSLAHTLLDDAAIRSAIIRFSLELGEGAFLTDQYGRFLFVSEHDLLDYLRPAVMASLQSGSLVAKGVAPSGAATGSRSIFEEDRWATFVPDWENNRVTCGGELCAVAIEVCRPREGQAVAQPKPGPARSEVASFVEERVEESRPPEGQVVAQPKPGPARSEVASFVEERVEKSRGAGKIISRGEIEREARALFGRVSRPWVRAAFKSATGNRGRGRPPKLAGQIGS